MTSGRPASRSDHARRGAYHAAMERIEDAPPPDLERCHGQPGAFPFTRGVYPRMDADGWLCTMRQYAVFGSA